MFRSAVTAPFYMPKEGLETSLTKASIPVQNS